MATTNDLPSNMRIGTPFRCTFSGRFLSGGSVLLSLAGIVIPCFWMQGALALSIVENLKDEQCRSR
ncbi:hypothetical protein [Labrenzia sp. MBR-25]